MENNNSRLENLMEQGNSYKRSKEYKRAIDCYDRVLLKDPKDTYALIMKGSAYDDLKEYIKAIDCFDKVLLSDP